MKGYDFTGWYLDDSLTQFAGAYHDTYRITEIQISMQSGKNQKDNSSVEIQETVEIQKMGDSSSDNTQDGDNSNETLNTYTIKYDANGGKTKNASVKVVKGRQCEAPGCRA